MPAIRTDSFLASGFTQANLGDAIKQAYINAGFSSTVDEFTSGSDRNLVFSHVVDAAKTYGTNFIKVRISSSLVIYQQILTSWNNSSKSGANGSTELQYSSTMSNSSPLSITSLNGGAEYKFVLLSQGVSNLWFLGSFAPANRPPWWDLNSFSYGFICSSLAGGSWRSSTINPYSNTEFGLNLGVAEYGTANPITNKRDLMIGLLLLTRSNAGIAGKSSDDFAQCCALGTTRYDIIQANNSQYLVVNPGAGALGIRIV